MENPVYFLDIRNYNNVNKWSTEGINDWLILGGDMKLDAPNLGSYGYSYEK